MRISPDLIPHSEFHTCIWLRSVERPLWYYFSRQQNPDAITNKDFISSVDEPLVELVEFLHKQGIKTTPSCSGHHISERNLEKIYQALESDGDVIRTTGLLLEEIETGRRHIFQDESYALPWNKEAFLEKVEVYQQKGVLGLRLGLPEYEGIKKELMKIEIPGVRIAEKDSILFIFTGEREEVDIKETWHKITEEVKRVFSEPLFRKSVHDQKNKTSYGNQSVSDNQQFRH